MVIFNRSYDLQLVWPHLLVPQLDVADASFPPTVLAQETTCHISQSMSLLCPALNVKGWMFYFLQILYSVEGVRFHGLVCKLLSSPHSFRWRQTAWIVKCARSMSLKVLYSWLKNVLCNSQNFLNTRTLLDCDQSKSYTIYTVYRQWSGLISDRSCCRRFFCSSRFLSLLWTWWRRMIERSYG